MRRDKEQLSLLRSRGEKLEEVASKRWRRYLDARYPSRSRLVRGEDGDKDHDDGNDDSEVTEAAKILLGLVEEDQKVGWHEPSLRPVKHFVVKRKRKKQYSNSLDKPFTRIPGEKHRRCARNHRSVPHHPSARIYTNQGDNIPMPSHLLSSSDFDPNIPDKDASLGNLASMESITPFMRSYDRSKTLKHLEGLNWPNPNSNPTQL